MPTYLGLSGSSSTFAFRMEHAEIGGQGMGRQILPSPRAFIRLAGAPEHLSREIVSHPCISYSHIPGLAQWVKDPVWLQAVV